MKFADTHQLVNLEQRSGIPFVKQLENDGVTVTKRNRKGNVYYQVESWLISDDEYVKHGKESFVSKTGVVYRKRQWDADLLHGVELVYDKSERHLICRRQWRNGCLHGCEEEFILLPTGNLYKFAQRFYNEGRLHGNENRQIVINNKPIAEESTHWVDGERHGLSQTRRLSDNRLMKETMFNHGKKHGKCTEYYRNGKVRRLCAYANDKKDGNFFIFSRDRSVLALHTYENGSKHGLQLDFNSACQLLHRETWFHGVLMSRYITEHANEKLLFCERTYRFENAS